MNGASPTRRGKGGASVTERNGIARTFFSFQRASRPTPDTFTTLNRTPGISPLALPRRPKPEMRTSSFSSTKLRQPSFLRGRFPNVGFHGITKGLRGRTYGNESSDLLPVLDELYTHTLADGRIGLFRLDANLLENDTLCV